ncbi:trypsin-like serine peptidase [Nonomuraea fastidiosa]|jgi:V8-like Glu-specific endopeptidase|uniref:trypsin-like serine peptidase n=1 Tax=Nonomuraea TaxID=83681 RepID=UPI0032498F0D
MHRRVALLSAAALALAGALAPMGTANAAGGPDFRRPATWTATDSWSERRTVSQYWTANRMLAAKPLNAPAPRRNQWRGPSRGNPWSARPTRGSAGSRTTWSAQQGTGHYGNGGQGTGNRGTGNPGTGGQGNQGNGGQGSGGQGNQGNGGQGTGGQGNGNQQRSAVNNSPGLRWTDGGAVVRTTGRVFFTTADGRNSSCSGTAVTSANESVVITAGHCVKLNGAAHRNWVFVPAFENGRRPFGTWVGTRMFTTQQWNAREDINFDVAAVVVAPLNGQTLTDVVGGQGVAFNQARRQQMFSFGYPAAEPFDGARLIYCSGRVFNDTVMTQDQGLRCNMTGGSSGGPWFLNFDPATGLGSLNSVNSFTYNFAPGFMFGPFFGDEAMAVYRAAESADAV